ncbi:MAG: hypothetical protein KDJ29_03850 [Hyphomicrobiales bacterium]|nr:hypothetical protein [Hyphomicrobiales bacterium]
MRKHLLRAFALAGLALVQAGAQVSACDIALPRGLKPDASESIPGWMVYRFTSAAPVAGHMLYSRVKQPKLPDRRAAGQLINARVRSTAAALFNRRVSAQKLELLEVKTFAPGPNGQSATGYAFVVILAFGTTSVRASGYLRGNVKAGDLSLAFSVTHPDEVHKALPIVEQFAAQPGHECNAG